jgi:hypothetical protein
MKFKKNHLILLCLILSSLLSNAQTMARENAPAKIDPFIPVLKYPLIKGSKLTGVVPVKNESDKPEADKV